MIVGHAAMLAHRLVCACTVMPAATNQYVEEDILYGVCKAKMQGDRHEIVRVRTFHKRGKQYVLYMYNSVIEPVMK